MAQISGVFRLGRDAEVRFTQSGDAVSNLSLAFNYGRKDQDGKRPSQWIDASLWGKRAESLAQYLLKGGQIYAVLSDPHIETYQKSDGSQASKLAATVLEIELIGSRQDGAQTQDRYSTPPQRSSAPANNGASYRDVKDGRAAVPAQQGRGTDPDMDDDIPF